MNAFRHPTRSERFGFSMSPDALVTVLPVKHPLEFVGAMLMAGVDADSAKDFIEVSEVLVVRDWFDADCETGEQVLVATFSTNSSNIGVMEIHFDSGATTEEINEKMRLVEQIEFATISQLKDVGFGEVWW